MLNDKCYALLIVVFISAIYLFPAFLGKIDTPIDIRDAQMYPWHYYAVDKKIKTVTLWEYDIGTSNPEILKIVTLPENKQDLTLKLSFDETLLKKVEELSDTNFELTFDFKIDSDELIKSRIFNLDVLFVNKLTHGYINIPVVVLKKEDSTNDKWYTAYSPLRGLIDQISSLQALSNYDLQITTNERSNSKISVLALKNLKITCKDFINATTVHNPFINDLIQWFTPAREIYSNSLTKWKIPFWTNSVLTGCELVAEPQVGFFHPLYMLCYFLFEHFTAHLVLSFILLTLAGVGAYLLSRLWGLGFAASIFTSLVYMFHPFCAKWFSFEHILMTSATLPFLIYFYEKNLKEKNIINKNLLISALLGGLIFLSGHLQVVYYTLIFFLLFALFRLFITERKISNILLQHIFSLAFIFCIALMIGSIVLIPFFPNFQDSYRVAHSKEFIKATSIPLKAFLDLMIPFYKDFPIWLHSNQSEINWSFFRNYIYYGFFPFLFSLLAFKGVMKDRLVQFFVVTIVIAILIFTGSPVFFLIKDYIPGFKQLQHYRFTEVYSYSVPFLSGIGFQIFLNHFSFVKKRIITIAVIIIFIFTAFDLMYHASYFVTWSNRTDYKPIPKGGSLEYLIKQKSLSDKPFRILPIVAPKIESVKLKLNIAQPNTLQPYGLEEASGYSSFVSKNIYNLFVYVQTKDLQNLYPEEILTLFPNSNIPYPIYNFKSKILDLLNVKYFMVPSIITLQAEKVRKVFDGDAAIYENLDYLPRAFVVPNYKIIENPKETIVYLDSKEFDPLSTVIVMNEPVIARSDEVTTKQSPNESRYEIASSAHSVPPRNDIEFVEYEPENIKLKVQIDTPGFLILGHNLNNNWKVKINGKKEEHFQANLIQRVVYLPNQGNYIVDFYYYPIKFYIGLLLSILGVIILLGLALYLRYKSCMQKSN
ncbi:MAG: hypothetical protein HYZ79_04720 [Candidatus Melainabacteria bacterium]|nr:hypothetical protein [Candidatus Melainabacteria bacterium]